MPFPSFKEVFSAVARFPADLNNSGARFCESTHVWFSRCRNWPPFVPPVLENIEFHVSARLNGVRLEQSAKSCCVIVQRKAPIIKGNSSLL